MHESSDDGLAKPKLMCRYGTNPKFAMEQGMSNISALDQPNACRLQTDSVALASEITATTKITLVRRVNMLDAIDLKSFNLSGLIIGDSQMLKKVKISDYEILTTIGVGTFGRVRLVKHKQTGKFFAAKILKKIEILKSKQIDHVQNQSQILNLLHHPFIIQLEGFTQDARYLYFIMEFVAGGELLSYLRSVSRLESHQACLYAAQIVLIFEHLHDKGIIFRDLKPENLLLSEDGYLKLTDFSFAKVIETRTYTLCGTPQYLAPEILLNQGHGKGVDWWTLGILIYEMNAGIDPFTDQDPMIIYQNILKGKVNFPKVFDKQVKSIIKHLLVADVSKRLGMLKGGAEDVKQHRWFSKIDWKALLAKRIPMSYKPSIKSSGDTSNFNNYPDSDNISQSLKPGDDPFLDW